MKISISLISLALEKKHKFISILTFGNRSLFTFSYSIKNSFDFGYKFSNRIFINLFFIFRKEIRYNIEYKYKDYVSFKDCICPYCQNNIPFIELYNTDDTKEEYKTYENECIRCPSCQKTVNGNYIPHLGDTKPDLY